jgi:integrase
MPTIRFTEKAIDRLAAPDPSGKQMLHWDSELKGFGVLCSGTSGAKSYVVQHALHDGRRRRVTLAPCNVMKLDQAVVEAKKVLATFYSGRDPKSLSRDNPTLKSTLEDYLALRTDLAANSRAFYSNNINRYLTPWLDLPLRSITREMVEERLRQIAKGVAGKGRDDYKGNASANGTMRALRAMYNFASERAPAGNPFPQNPVKLRKVWLPVEARKGEVPAADLKKFYKAIAKVQSPVAADFVRLVLFTGFRRQEAASLAWAHVDLDDKIIRLPATSTKAKRALDLPMSDFVYKLLKSRRALGDTKWVFPSNSKSGHLEEPKFALAEIADECGVRVSCHDLRRTFVTISESADIPEIVLKALVNHSLKANDVTHGYIQMTAERLRVPAQKVCDQMKRLCGI